MKISAAMNELLTELKALSSAEEFLEFFAISYIPAVVHVSRLHILKRFRQYLGATPGLTTLESGPLRDAYRDLLRRAYEDFVHSTPAQERVFRVFQDMTGKRVALASLRRTLPSRRAGTGEGPQTGQDHRTRG